MHYPEHKLCTSKTELALEAKFGPCMVAGHVPTLPWVKSRVWVKVRLGAGLASGRGG